MDRSHFYQNMGPTYVTLWGCTQDLIIHNILRRTIILWTYYVRVEWDEVSGAKQPKQWHPGMNPLCRLTLF